MATSVLRAFVLVVTELPFPPFPPPLCSAAAVDELPIPLTAPLDPGPLPIPDEASPVLEAPTA